MRYVMQNSCGCCFDDELEFASDEAAEKAVASVGLTSSGTIVDDNGDAHERLDTFYGIWRLEHDNVKEAQLVRLIDQLKNIGA